MSVPYTFLICTSPLFELLGDTSGQSATVFRPLRFGIIPERFRLGGGGLGRELYAEQEGV
jgi:hypothetical protein